MSRQRQPGAGPALLFCCQGRRRAVSLLDGGCCVLLLGAILAAPVCMVTMRLFFVTHRTFWQEMAWVLSAVFWCALGALCFLFICAWLDTWRSHSSSK
ncbi:inner membrane protein YbjM [Klebsiella pneumoniae subsp. pneumoniae]|nr:inner membrane protein YbjM [Klebsiella pneumoniae subsp. pneumoniae]